MDFQNDLRLKLVQVFKSVNSPPKYRDYQAVTELLQEYETRPFTSLAPEHSELICELYASLFRLDATGHFQLMDTQVVLTNAQRVPADKDFLRIPSPPSSSYRPILSNYATICEGKFTAGSKLPLSVTMTGSYHGSPLSDLSNSNIHDRTFQTFLIFEQQLLMVQVKVIESILMKYKADFPESKMSFKTIRQFSLELARHINTKMHLSLFEDNEVKIITVIKEALPKISIKIEMRAQMALIGRCEEIVQAQNFYVHAINPESAENSLFSDCRLVQYAFGNRFIYICFPELVSTNPNPRVIGSVQMALIELFLKFYDKVYKKRSFPKNEEYASRRKELVIASQNYLRSYKNKKPPSELKRLREEFNTIESNFFESKEFNSAWSWITTQFLTCNLNFAPATRIIQNIFKIYHKGPSSIKYQTVLRALFYSLNHYFKTETRLPIFTSGGSSHNNHRWQVIAAMISRLSKVQITDDFRTKISEVITDYGDDYLFHLIRLANILQGFPAIADEKDFRFRHINGRMASFYLPKYQLIGKLIGDRKEIPFSEVLESHANPSAAINAKASSFPDYILTPDSGVCGQFANGAVGVRQFINSRGPFTSQEDDFSMSFVADFPFEEETIRQFFLHESERIHSHLPKYVQEEAKEEAKIPQFTVATFIGTRNHQISSTNLGDGWTLVGTVVGEKEPKILQFSGATFASLVIDTRNHQISYANLGDGWTLLMTGPDDQKLEITSVHKPHRPYTDEERSRIQSEGGEIELSIEPDTRAFFESVREQKEPANFTVNKNLLEKCKQKSRILEIIKQNSSSPSKLHEKLMEYFNTFTRIKGKNYSSSVSGGYGDLAIPAMRRTPEVLIGKYSPADCNYIVFASDGLGEHGLTEEDIKLAVTPLLSQNKSSEFIATTLGELGLKSRSGDNMTIIFIKINLLPQGSIVRINRADGHGDQGTLSQAICSIVQDGSWLRLLKIPISSDMCSYIRLPKEMKSSNFNFNHETFRHHLKVSELSIASRKVNCHDIENYKWLTEEAFEENILDKKSPYYFFSKLKPSEQLSEISVLFYGFCHSDDHDEKDSKAMLRKIDLLQTKVNTPPPNGVKIPESDRLILEWMDCYLARRKFLNLYDKLKSNPGETKDFITNYQHFFTVDFKIDSLKSRIKDEEVLAQMADEAKFLKATLEVKNDDITICNLFLQRCLICFLNNTIEFFRIALPNSMEYLPDFTYTLIQDDGNALVFTNCFKQFAYLQDKIFELHIKISRSRLLSFNKIPNGLKEFWNIIPKIATKIESPSFFCTSIFNASINLMELISEYSQKIKAEQQKNEESSQVEVNLDPTTTDSIRF